MQEHWEPLALIASPLRGGSSVAPSLASAWLTDFAPEDSRPCGRFASGGHPNVLSSAHHSVFLPVTRAAGVGRRIGFSERVFDGAEVQPGSTYHGDDVVDDSAEASADAPRWRVWRRAPEAAAGAQAGLIPTSSSDGAAGSPESAAPCSLAVRPLRPCPVLPP